MFYKRQHRAIRGNRRLQFKPDGLEYTRIANSEILAAQSGQREQDTIQNPATHAVSFFSERDCAPLGFALGRQP